MFGKQKYALQPQLYEWIFWLQYFSIATNFFISLSTNIKWPNMLNNLSAIADRLSVFEHSVGLVLKGLNSHTKTAQKICLRSSKTCIIKAVASCVSVKNLIFCFKLWKSLSHFHQTCRNIYSLCNGLLGWLILWVRFLDVFFMVYFCEWNGYRDFFFLKNRR